MNAPSATLSPNHWCMFSWFSVPRLVPAPPPIVPPANVIFVCISSSKLAEGMPTTTPAVVNGYAPLKPVWKWVMSSWLSIASLFSALRVAAIELPWAW